MDINGNNGQMANNQQITPQMMAQALAQMMQQNGQIPNNPRPMSWDMPTNPMAAMWMNNMMNMMNNQNMNQPQQQNQNNQSVPQSQQTESTDPAVRMVKTPDEIKADEIPMNGSIRLFLQEDMNVIYGKRWTNNGVIENIRFVREEPVVQEVITEATPQVNFDYDALLKGLSDMMDQKLDQFKKEYSLEKRSSSKSSTKKGVSEDGE